MNLEEQFATWMNQPYYGKEPRKELKTMSKTAQEMYELYATKVYGNDPLPFKSVARVYQEAWEALAAACKGVEDDPETDGTDAAHPAYWRGEERGVAGACMRIREVIEEGEIHGACGEPIDSLRQKVLGLLVRSTLPPRPAAKGKLKIVNKAGNTLFEAEASSITELVSLANRLRAPLNNAYLANIGLRGARLEAAYLKEANLSGSDLIGAVMDGAELRKANLRHIDLRSASLSRANLSGAELQHADLRGADLEDANLNGANLTGVKLGGSNMRGVDLRGAIMQVNHELVNALTYREDL